MSNSTNFPRLRDLIEGDVFSWDTGKRIREYLVTGTEPDILKITPLHPEPGEETELTIQFFPERIEHCGIMGDGIHEYGRCILPRGHDAELHEDEEGNRWQF